VNVPRVVNFLVARARAGTYRHILLRDYPQIALSLTPEAIRESAENLSYSAASQARLDRHLGAVLLLDILPQKFHSYRDFGCSILRQLCEPTIFRALREGHVILSVGDYPKQKLERNFLLAGQNHPDGALHLPHLFKLCSDTLYQRALQANGLQDTTEGQETLAKAAMNLFQVQGPLHCRINPTKDAGNFWRDIFIAPLYQRIHQRKQKCPDTLHMRDVAAMLEILHAGYLQIREQVLECLQPLASRFDASAVLWFFEDTLPLISYSYDGVFKAGMYEHYLDALAQLELHAICQQRKNYKFSLLLKVAQILFLKDTSHPLYAYRM
jgi:hypothetical protein